MSRRAAAHDEIHVLQLVHDMEVGGTQRVVRDLASHFNRPGFRTSVCCLDDVGQYGRDLRREGIGVDALGRRPGFDWRLIFRLGRLYRQMRVDIVHAHQYTPYFYGANARLLAPGTKIIFTEHGRNHPDGVRPRRAAYNQLLRPLTSAYTAVSEFTSRSLVAFEKIPHRRIRLVYNGIETGAGEPSLAGAALRRQLALPADARVILTVGRLDRVKDFGTLIRALAEMLGSVPDAVLLLAGDGDATYRRELAELTGELGLDRRVRFLGNRNDVPDLLAACDVFALTSLTEAGSMTILEAMRAARPVVTTDVGGNGELVSAGETGLLVSAGDLRAVADALRYVLEHPDHAKRMGIAGRERVLARFDAAAAFEEYERLYREVLAL